MVRGAFGPIHPFTVEGWAYDDADLGAQLEVELRLDGVKIGQATANRQLQKRLHGAGGVDHGFLMQFQQALPYDARHRLTVTARCADGRMVELPFAPPSKPQASYPFSNTDPAQHPVLIMGSARSGTTAVMEALRSSTRYHGPGEGHLLELSLHLHLLIQHFYSDRADMIATGLDTLVSLVPEQFMQDAIRHTFITVAQVQFPSGRWLDKTPNSHMIAAAPLLQSIWPNARFIFCKRRAIENVASRLRRMPERSFEDHCHGWMHSMAAWLAVRDRIGENSIEIEHQTLAHKPAYVAERLRHLLSLTSDEVSLIATTLSNHQHERSNADFARIYSIDDLSWSLDDIDTFNRICGSTMIRYGYTFDKEYRRDDIID